MRRTLRERACDVLDRHQFRGRERPRAAFARNSMDMAGALIRKIDSHQSRGRASGRSMRTRLPKRQFVAAFPPRRPHGNIQNNPLIFKGDST
jgi:hypothetical protein